MMRCALPGLDRWIIGGLLCVLALISGCSAVQLSYNQGSTLAYWYLGRFVDFTPEQSQRVKGGLADWFAWHRGTQLLPYADELLRLQRQVVEDVSPRLVCSTFEGWQHRIDLMAEQALPAAAEVMRTLGPAQLAQIEKHQAEVLKDAEKDYLQAAADERREANLERTVKRAETLYGRLEEPQKLVLREALASSPFSPERWLAERRRRQHLVLRLLREWQADKPEPAVAEAALRRLFGENMHSTDPNYSAYQRRLTEANCTMAAQLHNATTPAQRRRAVDKLKGWETDLRTLASAKR